MTTATVPAHFDLDNPIVKIGITSYFLAIEHGPGYDTFGDAIDAFAQKAFGAAVEEGLPFHDALAANDIVYYLYRHNKFVA
jgi:hypothetical protein